MKKKGEDDQSLSCLPFARAVYAAPVPMRTTSAVFMRIHKIWRAVRGLAFTHAPPPSVLGQGFKIVGFMYIGR